MTISEPNAKPKVYRLRNLPGHVDRQLAAEILAQSLGDIAFQHIRIASLAHAVAEWSHVPTKTATVTFDKTPAIINAASAKEEWKIVVPALAKPLILDSHFQGVTPLNDVTESEHTHKYIELSPPTSSLLLRAIYTT